MSHSNKVQIQKTVKAITNCHQANFDFSDHSESFFDIDKKHLLDINNLHLPKNNLDDDVKAYADLGCCYYLFHDKKIDQEFCAKFQENPDNSKIFDSLEKVRISLISKQYYLGIFKNILDKFERDLNIVAVNDRPVILQILLLGQYLQNNEDEIGEYFEEIYFQTKENIKPEVLEKINELTKSINSQTEFSKESHKLIEFIDQKDLSKEDQGVKEKENHNQNNSLENQENEDLEQETEESQESQEEKQTPSEVKKDDNSSSDNNQEVITQSREINNEPEEDFPTQEKDLEFYSPYTIYSSNFDETIIPSKIIDKDELQQLRNLLDSKIDKLDNISKKLRLEFRKKLTSKQNIAKKQTQSEEVIDRKRLTQVISSPFKKNFYTTNHNQDQQNTVISILLDNSGSMRGSPIVISAMACQIIAQLLEEFSIKTEILGFTTADWRGGNSKKLWIENGKPENPGRLNDLRHIIYKSANQKLKNSKINLGLMLKNGILKENIDGEAILWAKSRLAQMSEERKILMVICDGTPVDDPTNSNNESEILIDHLNYVINRIEKDKKIELVGIGIGHDVDSYYKNSITIKNPEELGDVMIKKIIDLL